MILGAILSHIKACQAEGQEARADVLQCVESVSGVLSRWRATAEERREKGDFSPVEGFNSLHWVITP